VTQPLEGIRVIEAATLFAAPLASMLLGDFGADVVKIEHPQQPDPARGHGASKDGVGLWFKTLSRNKRLITLNLSHPDGRDVFLRLAESSDVVIENFRPGTLERWRLGPDDLLAVNPRIVVARISGFGQTGPSASRPGFGTLAEAMSGFAALNGEADGPPLLPPLALADGVTAFAAAFAILAALRAREETGRGQVVDLSLVEPLMLLLGPQLAQHDLLGQLQQRTGNRSSHNAPRNLYRTADDRWVAVSASANSVAERVLRLVGRADLVSEAWFSTRPLAEVVGAFEDVEAAIAPVYDASDLAADPQLRAIGAIADVPDAELGRVLMSNVVARLSETPGAIRWPGRAHGADTDTVLRELGIDPGPLRAVGAV
jgi:crotonobetainyl-CoA:carnitine CoA-transferase CaiB-like acyl-CoA transferase